jgi:hypothetical protein
MLLMQVPVDVVISMVVCCILCGKWLGSCSEGVDIDGREGKKESQERRERFSLYILLTC